MVKPGFVRASILLALVGVAGDVASAQTTLTVDCAGASIPSTGSTPDIVRTSTAVISAAPGGGYQFAFNPIVVGTGVFGPIVIPTARPLQDVLNGFFPGGGRTLFGAMRTPAGTLPTRLDYETITTVVSGFNISLTLDQQLLADGRGQAAIRNIVRPTFLGLNVNSGGLVVNTWTPPAPLVSEWHFDGNLQSVKESGLAPTSGPSKIRYLDDPAFGPMLGGVGAETTYPIPPTPTGVTQAQSSFGTTTSFGLPALGATGADTVYKTSPPRNAGAPTDTAKSRGLGLALWPNTRDTWPDERLGQWTIVADIFIPQASWDAARANSAANNQCIPLIEASQNNNTSADVFVLVTGASPGAAKVGNSVAYASAPAAPAIQPGQWMRLAIVNNLYGANQSRVFVNGTLAATIPAANWVYNACKSADPRWGDNTTPPPATNATTIPAATWSGPGGWGGFPSPWAYSGSPDGTGTATGAPTAATLGLFCDINGWGESIYIANMLFTDEPMSDAAVASLGGPNARGIVYLRSAPPPPCPADFNGMGGVTVQDIFDFLGAWFAGDSRADFNGVNGITVQDIFDFLSAWFAGCP